MNPFKSISARIDSAKKTLNSRYWEYARYYEDGVVWDNTFLFESFGGANFQGNPYYIYRELINRTDCRSFKIYISAKNPEEIKKKLAERELLPDNTEIIEIHSAKYREVLSHAKYLVNNVSFTMNFIKKDGQVYLNTWHGTPLKTLGRSVLGGDAFAVSSPQRNFLLCDYLIAPNDLTKRVYLYDHMINHIMTGNLVSGGYPRNSVFYDKEAEQKVKDNYGLNGYKTIFYMPTWRGNTCGVDKVDQVSDIERLAKELGKEYKVFVKFHPAMGKTSGDFKYCCNMPFDIEVYEFLNAMDILITDYSSVFFDFVGTGKRIILYQYDRDEYFKSRGIYHEVEESLCFPIAETYDQLFELIQKEDKNDYSDFVKRYCPYDSIRSAKDALEMLLSEHIVENETEPVDLYVIDSPVSDEEILRLQKELIETNYRLVFVLNRRSHGYSSIHSWDKLEYFSVNTYNRLSFSEKTELFFCSIFKTKKAKERKGYLCSRERRRLWGNTKIGKVYTRTTPRLLPPALRNIAEKKDF